MKCVHVQQELGATQKPGLPVLSQHRGPGRGSDVFSARHGNDLGNLSVVGVRAADSAVTALLNFHFL